MVAPPTRNCTVRCCPLRGRTANATDRFFPRRLSTEPVFPYLTEILFDSRLRAPFGLPMTRKVPRFFNHPIEEDERTSWTHSLETRVRHGRRASLRLTSDEEAACRDASSCRLPCSSHLLRKRRSSSCKQSLPIFLSPCKRAVPRKFINGCSRIRNDVRWTEG
nr:PREDICTED: uncharacterized protein LOC105664374 [Megachile rotundata]